MPSFVASREKIKHSGGKIPAKCCKMTSSKKAILVLHVLLFTKYN